MTSENTPPSDDAQTSPGTDGPTVGDIGDDVSEPVVDSETSDAATASANPAADNAALGGAAAKLAEERLGDLQRLQAEYVNYRKRVERDRDVAREGAISSVLEALLPVLDDIELARQHGDLAEGPFAAIAEKLESTLGRYGLARYGETGTVFDPNVHEALLHSESDEVTEPTVNLVMQPGYMVGEKVLRAARVGVAAPGN